MHNTSNLEADGLQLDNRRLKNVAWSDESLLRHSGGRVRTESTDPSCLIWMVQDGRGGVTVWRIFSCCCSPSLASYSQVLWKRSRLFTTTALFTEFVKMYSTFPLLIEWMCLNFNWTDKVVDLVVSDSENLWNPSVWMEKCTGEGETVNPLSHRAARLQGKPGVFGSTWHFQYIISWFWWGQVPADFQRMALS